MAKGADPINAFWRKLLTNHADYQIDVGCTLQPKVDDQEFHTTFEKKKMNSAPPGAPIGYELRTRKRKQVTLFRDNGKLCCCVRTEVSFSITPEGTPA